MPGINDLLRQVLEVHRKVRPDLFKGGAKKYKDDELAEIISDGKRLIFVAEDEVYEKCGLLPQKVGMELIL